MTEPKSPNLKVVRSSENDPFYIRRFNLFEIVTVLPKDKAAVS